MQHATLSSCTIFSHHSRSLESNLDCMRRIRQAICICIAVLFQAGFTVSDKDTFASSDVSLLMARHRHWSAQRAAFIRKQIRLQNNGARELPILQQPASDVRHDSYPLISGDTYRSVCHWVFDETTHSDWDASQVQAGHMIFVKTEMLDAFFTRLHPLILRPYVLISSNSDDPSPGPYVERLNDTTLSAWFGQNGDAEHPKFYPLPIGFPNQRWDHGNLTTLLEEATQSQVVQASKLLYVNLDIATNPRRQGIIDHLKAWQIVDTLFFAERRSHQQYLKDVKESMFVLSPPGNGLDCHRTWEAIFMGSIPVVASHSFDESSASSPVLVVKDFWQIQASQLLTYKHPSFKSRGVFANYWFKLFKVACHKAMQSEQHRLHDFSDKQRRDSRT